MIKFESGLSFLIKFEWGIVPRGHVTQGGVRTPHAYHAPETRECLGKRFPISPFWGDTRRNVSPRWGIRHPIKRGAFRCTRSKGGCPKAPLLRGDAKKHPFWVSRTFVWWILIFKPMALSLKVTLSFIFHFSLLNITMKWLGIFESGSNIIGFHMEKVEF